MAKLYASQTAMDVTTKCVQLHGGYGFTKDYPVERMMRMPRLPKYMKVLPKYNRWLLQQIY